MTEMLWNDALLYTGIIAALWYLPKVVKLLYVYFHYTRNFIPGRPLTLRQRFWLTRAYFAAEEYEDD